MAAGGGGPAPRRGFFPKRGRGHFWGCRGGKKDARPRRAPPPPPPPPGGRPSALAPGPPPPAAIPGRVVFGSRPSRGVSDALNWVRPDLLGAGALGRRLGLRLLEAVRWLGRGLFRACRWFGAIGRLGLRLVSRW